MQWYGESLLVIFICTLIQSVFGVGILVFGTPILLSLGYDYLTVIGILCPASFAVSLVQILSAKNTTLPDIKLLIQSGFGVTAGVFFLSTYSVPKVVYLVTSAAMFFAAVLRLSKSFRHFVGRFLAVKYQSFYLLNGFFHGYSNLGGILLVLKHSLHDTERNQMLINTSAVYLVYVIFQILILTLSGHAYIFKEGFIIAPIVAFMSFFIGRKPTLKYSSEQMDMLLGIFFLLAGFAVLIKLKF